MWRTWWIRWAARTTLKSLTTEIEKRVQAYLDEIDRMGGSLKAIEKGYVQQEIANSAYDYQKAVDSGEQVIVGVNKYATEEHHGAELLHVGAELEAKQMERLKKLRARTRQPEGQAGAGQGAQGGSE